MPPNGKILFRTIGGRSQLAIDGPEDLRAISAINEAWWMCVSAPVESFICDPAFTKFLDSDGNGRIRADELRKGVDWLLDVLSDISILADTTPEIPIAAINSSSAAGAKVKAAAERILANLGADNASKISLDQARSRQAILASGERNGDGVIPLDAVKDAATREFVESVMATLGNDTDAGGKPGVSVARVERFLKEVEEYLAWLDKGTSDAVMVWGADTVPAYSAIAAVKPKVEEFFRQCDLLATDPSLASAFRANEKKREELDVNNTAAMDAFLAAAPLATPSPEATLPLDEGLNPLYRDSVQNLREQVLKKFLHRRSPGMLSKGDWIRLNAEFAEFAEWNAAKPATPVEALGEDKLRKLAKAGMPKRLRALFDKDMEVAGEIAGIAEVEKLILFKANILEFTRNFVSFQSLLDPTALSMAQVGRLVMDGRRFDLNMEVRDRATHKKVAELSDICVMYLELTSKLDGKEEKMEVATAVTSGDVSNLRIGKQGVFVTRDNREWDAKVVDFIQRPVSISEALKAPFVKLGAFFKRQTDKLTASSYDKLEAGIGKGLTTGGATIAKPAPKSGGTPAWAGPLMLLGGGIGLAGLGSAFASVMNALKDNAVVLRIFLFIAGMALIVAIPIVVSAVLKLRRRNIGMFLEAADWAMNSPMRLTRRMGLLFTRIPDLPKNASKCKFDHTSQLLKKAGIKPGGRLGILVAIAVILLLALIAVRFLSSTNKRQAEKKTRAVQSSTTPAHQPRPTAKTK